MAISHTAGLYVPFKLNRPLTDEERKDRFYQGHVKPHNEELAVQSFNTVIRMNSTYLEVVDKFYATKGTICSMMMCMLLLLMGLIFLTLWGMMFSPEHKNDFFSGLFVCLLMALPAYFFFWRILKKDWFRKTHYPVRFNRQKQMVHIYQVNSEELSVSWWDIYFTVNQQAPFSCIVGHILAEDGETVLNTFSFGYTGFKPTLDRYWEFVRCYMEEDFLDDLADMIVLCPPIENRREGYIWGLQNMLKVSSRLEWPMALLMSPLNFIESIGRYIAMQTSKIPQWSQDVLDACPVANSDPINVGSECNPGHLWRYVLANEPRDVFDARDRKLESANARIREKLANRYGEKQ